MVALTAKEGETIKAKREADRQALLNADSLTVQWKNDKESFRDDYFKRATKPAILKVSSREIHYYITIEINLLKKKCLFIIVIPALRK